MPYTRPVAPLGVAFLIIMSRLGPPMPTAKPVAASTAMEPKPPSQPVPATTISTAPMPIDQATTRSLAAGMRAATKPPANMPAAPHSM